MTQDLFLPLLATILAANILTVVFGVGAIRLTKVHNDKDAPLWAILCCVAPLLVTAAGAIVIKLNG